MAGLAEAPGSAAGGQHQRGGQRQGAAAVVEVVGVVVVADQHQVHRPELVLGDRRADGLGEVAVRAGGVEGGSLTMRRPPRSRTVVGPPTTMAAHSCLGITARSKTVRSTERAPVPSCRRPRLTG